VSQKNPEANGCNPWRILKVLLEELKEEMSREGFAVTSTKESGASHGVVSRRYLGERVEFCLMVEAVSFYILLADRLLLQLRPTDSTSCLAAGISSAIRTFRRMEIMGRLRVDGERCPPQIYLKVLAAGEHASSASERGMLRASVVAGWDIPSIAFLSSNLCDSGCQINVVRTVPQPPVTSSCGDFRLRGSHERLLPMNAYPRDRAGLSWKSVSCFPRTVRWYMRFGASRSGKDRRRADNHV